MNMKLNNKVALITGGSSGIGKASSILFAKDGAKVVIADVNDEGGNQTVEEIIEMGFSAAYVHADVSKSEDCRKMIEFAESTYGKLDILFNNAGIMDSRDDNAEVTDEDT